MSQKTNAKYDSISELDGLLSRYDISRIFLVTGKASYITSGARDALRTKLPGGVIHFDDFDVNPKLPDVVRGIELYRKNKCDLVIAVGGGSVLDMAKSIRLLIANPGDPRAYIEGKREIENQGAPLIAIPTTAGTGCEATHFATVHVPTENGYEKCSLAHCYMLPDIAIVDPQFTMSMPPYLTACTGMDALAQGIESLWCGKATPKSKTHARKAIKLAYANLRVAVNDPNPYVREAMLIAANESGEGINLAQTTACHAWSYVLTAIYGVPHGHAVALTLGPMLIYNSNVTEDDLQGLRQIDDVTDSIQEICGLLGADDPLQANDNIQSLMRDVGLETRLNELGIGDEAIEGIIGGVNIDRLTNNPRKLDNAASRRIFESIR